MQLATIRGKIKNRNRPGKARAANDGPAMRSIAAKWRLLNFGDSSTIDPRNSYNDRVFPVNAPERDDREPPPVDDDDAELELEPPDETIEARQRQIALEAIRANIDIDEIYRDADRDYGSELIEKWLRNFRFRFQVKHLLIATAVLSIIMALVRLQMFWPTAIAGFMVLVGGSYLYLRWEEQKKEAEATRRREALYARRRALLAANAAGQPLDAADMPPLPNAIDELWQKSLERESFRFQFSLRQLLMMITIAAVLLGMMRLFGGAEALASVLGLVALFGLILYATGVEAPQLIILGWWVILAMYVLLSITMAVLSVFR